MKKRYFRAAIFAMLAATTLVGKAQQINPMAEAAIRGYSEILAENPKDYYTLLDRATQYYNMGNYDRALSDVDLALEYTPKSDKDYRQAELSMKAEILLAQKKYKPALEATNAALEINPSSQSDLYRMGNLFLLVNNGEGALKAFQQLQRENSRSQEAFYGMAKANVILGRNDAATDLIQEIENLGKNSFITYCRIGDLYSDMGKTREATSNYIKAFLMDQSSKRPLESIRYLASKDYPTVIQTIDTYEKASSEDIGFSYVKVLLTYEAGDYKTVAATCEDLISKMDKENPSLYRMLAVAQKALNQTAQALDNINKAEAINPEDGDILTDKADILLSSDASKALETAEKALRIDPDNEYAMLTGAKAAIMAGNSEKALPLLNEIILINPSNIQALLLRGYLNEILLKDGKTAVQDYGRAGSVNSDNASEMALSALGKSKAGKKLDSDGMIKDAESMAAGDKNALYNIAIYYAQTGDLEKAKDFTEQAIKAGYTNLYNIKGNNEPLLNLTPIHHLMN